MHGVGITVKDKLLCYIIFVSGNGNYLKRSVCIQLYYYACIRA